MNRDLADTHEEITGNGATHFYDGSLSDRIVEYYDRCDGRFTAREFSQYRPRWLNTLEATYRDSYRVVGDRQNKGAVCGDGGVLMWSLSGSSSV